MSGRFCFGGSPLDIKQARQKYRSQKMGAKRRGIDWQLTFEQWLEWWGPDLDSRGRRGWQLSMQRIADSGPYALDNIRKGAPKDNGHTRSLVYKTKRTLRARLDLVATQNALPALSRDDDCDEAEDESISDYMSRDPDKPLMRKRKWDSIHS
jgi:hypothetical protein